MSHPDMQSGNEAPGYGTFQDQSYAPGQPQPPQQEPARLGPFERFIGIIFSPGETFADINRKPTWLVPVIISILLAVGFSFFFKWRVNLDMDQIVRNQIKQAMERRNQPMPPEEAIQQQVAISKVIANIFPLVGPPLLTLFLSGVFALGLLIMAAQTTFKKILSVVAWSSLATTLVYYLVAGASLMVRDPSTVDPTQPGSIAATNLAAFISVESRPLQSVLASIDIFTIWFLILLSMGFAAISGAKKMKSSKTGTLVFGLWAVWVLISAGFAALF